MWNPTIERMVQAGFIIFFICCVLMIVWLVYAGVMIMVTQSIAWILQTGHFPLGLLCFAAAAFLWCIGCHILDEVKS